MIRFFSLLLLIPFLFSCNAGNGAKEKGIRTLTCSGLQTTDIDWYSSGKKAPIFRGLEGIDFRISTDHPEAQVYFNQGMMLAYGFNHAEAARSFFESTRLDPACAMAYWGYAYVLGPNYNGGMEEDNYRRAYDAVVKAKSLSKNCTAMEIALINALALRYAAAPPTDRTYLDIAYATAMKKIYAQYPTHPDVGALYADALLNLHPWDLYDKVTKLPKAWTPELVALLERLIQSNPRHPGAHHFYIHALEASANPEKALPSAYLLDTLVPGSGHLMHMPSHIYIHTGDYHLGTLSNLRAIAVDSAYTTACHAQGVYALAYYPHNYHFLTATAALEGHSALAWTAAEKLQLHIATELMDRPEWSTLQHYYTIPYYIAVRFGMWDRILSLPAPVKDLVYLQAIRHYARGMACLAKDDMIHAMRESDILRVLAADTSLQYLTVWDINTMMDLAQIATRVLSAGIAAKQNDYERSISLLQEAIAIEDNLNYNEPPDWFFSVRHHLGAVLIRAGQYKEAESVYRVDLQKWKRNGWALMGLYNSLLRQQRNIEAQRVRAAFDEAWQYADIDIVSSSPIFE